MIDWQFIGTLEGRKLQGYVPNPSHSKSGVTVATGCDIGHMSDEDFLSLPNDLQNLLEPYRFMVGLTAAATLRAQPLTITDAQADILDARDFSGYAAFARAQYDHAEGPGAFGLLPDAAQTIIASVAFQWGNLPRRCPKFWSAVCCRDWRRTIDILWNFGDDYPTRRRKEATYLAEALGIPVPQEGTPT